MLAFPKSSSPQPAAKRYFALTLTHEREGAALRIQRRIAQLGHAIGHNSDQLRTAEHRPLRTPQRRLKTQSFAEAKFTIIPAIDPAATATSASSGILSKCRTVAL